MPAHQPILPAKALDLVEARKLDGAGALLADFAAAGLIKTYALMREIRQPGGSTEAVRNAQIPQTEWERIIAENKIETALNGGTVRLGGSHFVGGMPSIQITGVSFSEASIIKILDHYCNRLPHPLPKTQAKSTANQARKQTMQSTETSKSKSKPVPPIKPGDLTASIAQTMQATGLGRTKINELMNNGTLERKKIGRRTLISVESIERLLGVRIAH